MVIQFAEYHPKKPKNKLISQSSPHLPYFFISLTLMWNFPYFSKFSKSLDLVPYYSNIINLVQEKKKCISTSLVVLYSVTVGFSFGNGSCWQFFSVIHVSRCELCTEKGEGGGDVIKTEKMERRPPREGRGTWVWCIVQGFNNNPAPPIQQGFTLLIL